MRKATNAATFTADETNGAAELEELTAEYGLDLLDILADEADAYEFTATYAGNHWHAAQGYRYE